MDAVNLPAHAQSSLLGCDAVFCNLSFSDGDIGGSAEVRDGVITMQGGSAGGDWSATGTVATDGSFSILAEFSIAPDHQVAGTVVGDCLRVAGEFQPLVPASPFACSGLVTGGADSIDDCLDD